jgi:hypothetical protein
MGRRRFPRLPPSRTGRNGRPILTLKLSEAGAADFDGGPPAAPVTQLTLPVAGSRKRDLKRPDWHP